VPLRFINPNLHVILIHYPLGVFVLGVVLELLGFLWRGSSLKNAARWMIVLGALASLPAATSGIYALFDVRHFQKIDAASYHFLRQHVIFMGIGSILAVACAVAGIGASDKWRKTLYWYLLAGVVAALAMMVIGAWNGGETIYQNGTSVAILKVKIVTDADDNPVKDANGKPVFKTALVPLKEETHSFKEYNDVVKYYIGGDLQQHLIFSGLALAFALGALGLSIRRINVGPNPAVSNVMAIPETPREAHDLATARSFKPDAALAPKLPDEYVPSGKLWLVASLAIILTAAMGYWVLAGSAFFTHGGWDTFQQSLKPDDPAVKVTRHLAHLVLGGAFLALVLICAILAVAAPRNSAMLMFFGTLLVLVIVAQVWMGVLLTFDKEGPLTRFKTAADTKDSEAAAVVSYPAVAQR